MKESTLTRRKFFIWVIAGILLFIAFEILLLASSKDSRLEPGQPRILEFYSDNCPACEMMKPIMEEIRKECNNSDLEIDYVNVRNPKVVTMVMKFRVFGVPTLIFLDREGREIERLVGLQPKAKIKEIANELTNGQCGI